jgi:hypothetical protein
MKTISYPSLIEVIKPILEVKATLNSDTLTIDEWRKNYLDNIKTERAKSKIQIFNIFASALLERQMRGETYSKRIQLMNSRLNEYKDITPDMIKGILKEVGYRWVDKGVEVVLELKRLTENDFVWENYFKKAEANFLSNFMDDPFLKIRFVGIKVRDFALSEFSSYYLANDLHIVKLIKRTGLLLDGYGDYDFGTNQFDEKEYLFLKRLIIKLAKESGWEDGAGFSPGEIDKIFWNFGRTICKPEPLCSECPIKDICLTGKNRRET